MSEANLYYYHNDLWKKTLLGGKLKDGYFTNVNFNKGKLFNQKVIKLLYGVLKLKEM